MTVAHAIITSHASARSRAHFISLLFHFLYTVFAFSYSALRHDARLEGGVGRGGGEREKRETKARKMEQGGRGRIEKKGERTARETTTGRPPLFLLSRTIFLPRLLESARSDTINATNVSGRFAHSTRHTSVPSPWKRRPLSHGLRRRMTPPSFSTHTDAHSLGDR